MLSLHGAIVRSSYLCVVSLNSRSWSPKALTRRSSGDEHECPAPPPGHTSAATCTPVHYEQTVRPCLLGRQQQPRQASVKPQVLGLADIARHVIDKHLNPRLLSKTGMLADIARPVIDKHVHPRVLNKMASHDVASNTRLAPGPTQPLRRGGPLFCLAEVHVQLVGPGIYCSPRHGMPSNSRNDGSQCVG